MTVIKKDTSFFDAKNPAAERFVVIDNERECASITGVYTVRELSILSLSFLTDDDKTSFSDALIRAALNAAQLRGIPKAVCFGEEYFDVLCESGFLKETALPACVSVDIDAFFLSNSCSGKK